MASIFYIQEKLSNAVYVLAVGEGDVRERLVSAFIACITLKPKDFPPEFQKDWEWVLQQLTKYGPIVRDDGSVFRGSVENTMSRIKRKTGAKIARKIYELHDHLNSEKYS